MPREPAKFDLERKISGVSSKALKRGGSERPARLRVHSGDIKREATKTQSEMHG